MTLTEIKKVLYREKPLALYLHVCKRKDGVFLLYGCTLDKNSSTPDVIFEVPVEELEYGIFGKELPAKLLIRYIVSPELTQS